MSKIFYVSLQISDAFQSPLVGVFRVSYSRHLFPKLIQLKSKKNA